MRLIEQNVILAGLYGTNQVGYIFFFKKITIIKKIKKKNIKHKNLILIITLSKTNVRSLVCYLSKKEEFDINNYLLLLYLKKLIITKQLMFILFK